MRLSVVLEGDDDDAGCDICYLGRGGSGGLDGCRTRRTVTIDITYQLVIITFPPPPPGQPAGP